MRERARSEAETVRALLVTYVFPPVGGAGVARTLKLAKFLPSHGVEPSVLTCGNPSVPVYDETLLADVPPGMEVLRARTFEPAYAAKAAVWGTGSRSQDGEIKANLRPNGVLSDLRRAMNQVADISKLAT